MSFGSEEDWGNNFGPAMPPVTDNTQWPKSMTNFITNQLSGISLEDDAGGTFTFFAQAMETGLLSDPSIVGIFKGVTAYIGTSTVVVPKDTQLGGIVGPPPVNPGKLESPGVGVLDPTSVVDALAKLGTLEPAVEPNEEFPDGLPERVEGGLADAAPTNDATQSAFPKLMQQCFSELRYVCTGVDASGNPIGGILGVE